MRTEERWKHRLHILEERFHFVIGSRAVVIKQSIKVRLFLGFDQDEQVIGLLDPCGFGDRFKRGALAFVQKLALEGLHFAVKLGFGFALLLQLSLEFLRLGHVLVTLGFDLAHE